MRQDDWDPPEETDQGMGPWGGDEYGDPSTEKNGTRNHRLYPTIPAREPPPQEPPSEEAAPRDLPQSNQGTGPGHTTTAGPVESSSTTKRQLSAQADVTTATTTEPPTVRKILQPHITPDQEPQATEERTKRRDGSVTETRTSLAATEETAMMDIGLVPATEVATTPPGRGNPAASDGAE